MRAPFLLVDRSLDVDGLAAAAPGVVVPLLDDQRHHLERVLRRAPGDPVVVADGAGRVAPAALRSDGVELTGPVEVVDRAAPTVTVAHALPKGRGFDDVVRMLVELGVDHIEPVVTARTESRPTGDRAEKAADRWRAIARAAAEQARSAHLCGIAVPIALRTDDPPPPGTRAVLADPAASATLGSALADGDPRGSIRLLIGPEGGFTPTEVMELAHRGWVAARAGGTVLRSVHAATVLVAAAMALTGRYGPPPAAVRAERSVRH